MVAPLETVIRRFQALDRQTRLELLLDYSRKLPELPQRFHAARDQGLNLVPECQSPVYLFLERQGDGLVLHADAPREAPTVRGFVALLAKGIEGMSPAAVAELPEDLLDQLGLAEALGMTRMHGLTAMIARIRRMAREMGEESVVGR
jgi:cysteine desulfuration protein SufE